MDVLRSTMSSRSQGHIPTTGLVAGTQQKQQPQQHQLKPRTSLELFGFKLHSLVSAPSNTSMTSLNNEEASTRSFSTASSTGSLSDL
ncbi:hypothetical protein HDV05_003277, partial [Chytridiales sp. JEL 0842]